MHWQSIASTKLVPIASLTRTDVRRELAAATVPCFTPNPSWINGANFAAIVSGTKLRRSLLPLAVVMYIPPLSVWYRHPSLSTHKMKPRRRLVGSMAVETSAAKHKLANSVSRETSLWPTFLVWTLVKSFRCCGRKRPLPSMPPLKLCLNYAFLIQGSLAGTLYLQT